MSDANESKATKVAGMQLPFTTQLVYEPGTDGHIAHFQINTADGKFFTLPPHAVSRNAEATTWAETIVTAVNSHAALVAALECIADGTTDTEPPYKCAPREALMKFAADALDAAKALS